MSFCVQTGEQISRHSLIGQKGSDVQFVEVVSATDLLEVEATGNRLLDLVHRFADNRHSVRR